MLALYTPMLSYTYILPLNSNNITVVVPLVYNIKTDNVWTVKPVAVEKCFIFF